MIAPAVIEEVRELLLRLRLVRDDACALQALRSRHRRHHGGQIGELRRLQSDQLIAGLGGLPRARRRLARRGQGADLRARRIEVLDDARLHLHGVLKAGERVLPARLCRGEELLRRGRTGMALRIGLPERLIDRRDVVGDALRLDEKLLGSRDRLLKLC